MFSDRVNSLLTSCWEISAGKVKELIFFSSSSSSFGPGSLYYGEEEFNLPMMLEYNSWSECSPSSSFSVFWFWSEISSSKSNKSDFFWSSKRVVGLSLIPLPFCPFLFFYLLFTIIYGIFKQIGGKTELHSRVYLNILQYCFRRKSVIDFPFLNFFRAFVSISDSSWSCILKASFILCELKIEMLFPRLFFEKHGSMILICFKFIPSLNWSEIFSLGIKPPSLGPYECDNSLIAAYLSTSTSSSLGLTKSDSNDSCELAY